MSTCISLPITEELESIGQDLYKKNKHYQNLANAMEHPLSREIYDKYLSEWNNAKTMIMFMQLYEKIGDNFNGYQKIALIDQIIKNSSYRSIICADMNNSTKNNTIILYDKNNT
jgi:hypothetical protein